MNYYKEMKQKLNKLHKIQWTKKQQLRKVVASQASAQRRLHKNKVIGPEGHPGAEYVPLKAVTLFQRCNKTISALTKDLNSRKVDIRVLESQVWTIKNTISKDVYFKDPESGDIHGIHAVGDKGPEGEFYQQEIWANKYVREDDGSLKMRGGSMRVFETFEEASKAYVNEGWLEVKAKI